MAFIASDDEHPIIQFSPSTSPCRDRSGYAELQQNWKISSHYRRIRTFMRNRAHFIDLSHAPHRSILSEPFSVQKLRWIEALRWRGKRTNTRTDGLTVDRTSNNVIDALHSNWICVFYVTTIRMTGPYYRSLRSRFVTVWTFYWPWSQDFPGRNFLMRFFAFPLFAVSCDLRVLGLSLKQCIDATCRTRTLRIPSTSWKRTEKCIEPF